MNTPASTPRDERWRVRATLPGASYVSAQTYAEEMSAIFARTWTCVGRCEEAPKPGDYVVRELIGESLLLVRGGDDRIRAWHNVCRHRGTRLCEADGHSSGTLTCPYHAWTYRIDDGALIRTPNVGNDEGLDRRSHSLVSVRCDEWEGFVFVNLAGNARPLAEALADDPEYPTQFARFRMGSLRAGVSSESQVAANWKIVVENYHECLHCAVMHPELVRLIPTYRRGSVGDDPDSWGVPLADGVTSLTLSGRSRLPVLPGLEPQDLTTCYGCYVFPNLILDFSADCVTWDAIFPLAPDRIATRGGYLFDPATIADPGFDPSEVVEFGDLVTQQDNAICERVQKGMSSAAYARGGVFPFQDRYVHAFVERYLRAMKDGGCASR